MAYPPTATSAPGGTPGVDTTSPIPTTGELAQGRRTIGGVVAPIAEPFDERRARRLRAAKRRASGLLVLAVVVFALTFLTSGEGIWGYVRAMAEAAMVGGVADWFAVTALFRHPLGIPIPHTALIPRGKEAIGIGLGEFIRHNFLDREHLVARLRQADPARRLGEWLADPDHASTVAGQVGVIVSVAAQSLDTPELQERIRTSLTDRIRQIEPAPAIGSTADWLITNGHHRPVITSVLRALTTIIADQRGLLRSRLHQESPWWVPGELDNVVFDRLYRGVQRFLTELIHDEAHPLRKQLEVQIEELADDLKNNAELQRRVAEVRDEILNHPEVGVWVDRVIADFVDQIHAAAGRPDSELRQRITEAIVDAGQRIQTDEHLRQQIDDWATRLASQLVEESGSHVADVVASTVGKWDAEETSRRLELQVGRDLQFVRINGTLVGGLVGLLIHTVVELSG